MTDNKLKITLENGKEYYEEVEKNKIEDSKENENK